MKNELDEAAVKLPLIDPDEEEIGRLLNKSMKIICNTDMILEMLDIFFRYRRGYTRR